MKGQLRNIEVEKNGGLLVLKIDLSEELGPSASGKSILIASSGGGVTVANVDGKQVVLNLTAYRYANDKKGDD